eukprot:TRINITY_DN7892_c0_g1_i2.p1 TRINITY_DN7892_c0_g1~~TRINITY_DN7892_c0_g1_i2.p1  ORF type:complete len:321 (+),score=67.25 TRINITY_DN7892_c0_g1_i2:3-965(+)
MSEARQTVKDASQIPPSVAIGSNRRQLPKGNGSRLEDLTLVLLIMGIIATAVAVGIMYFLPRESEGRFWGSSLRKTPDSAFTIKIPLGVIATGGSITVKRNRQKICPSCDGQGAEDPNDVQTCSLCHGAGVRTVIQQMGPFQMQSKERCPKCGGQGVTITKPCAKCGGHRHVHTDEELVINIPKGIPENHVLILPQESDEMVGHAPGDVHVQVTSERDPKFSRRGDDLSTQMHLSLLDALIGYTIELNHVDGHAISSQKTNITSPNEIVTFKGEGLPIMNNPDQKGDLHVEMKVSLPKSLTSEQKKGFKELLSGQILEEE